MKDIIPPKARSVVYSIFALIGVGLGATQVGFASANAGQPTWLTVALAVFAFIGGAIGFTAQQNTPVSELPSDIQARFDSADEFVAGLDK